jgi:hypothetical protein
MEENNEDQSIENPVHKTDDILEVLSPNILVEMKKTWKDYLFEFTVPFLAVTAAFFLNTQREEYVEHSLEKQYIQSIINDFENDAKLIDSQVSFHLTRIEQMDSLFAMLEFPDSIQNFDKLYYLSKLATRNVTFTNNEGTFEQMKNSATFRLIRNQAAANGIIDYYQKIKTINLVEEREKSDQEEYKRIAVQVFDPFASKNLKHGAKINPRNIVVLTISKDKLLLRQMAGYIQYLNTSRSRLIFLKQDLKKTGATLMQKFKKDYRL